jgi:single-stranded-DNA-specific exonuclease
LRNIAEAKKQKKWNVHYRLADRETETSIREIAAGTGLSEMTARLLYIRGYRYADAANRFLKMEETAFHNPFLLGGMQSATDRIREAIANGEKIAIYGDYDVDGVTSVSLLYLYLKEYDADVVYYIPSRSLEG